MLPVGIPAVARHFEGHDLVVAFGAAIFRHHEFMEGDYLPAGSELWAVTSDPDEAARAPLEHILIGDPADAMVGSRRKFPRRAGRRCRPANHSRTPMRPALRSPPRRSSTR